MPFAGLIPERRAIPGYNLAMASPFDDGTFTVDFASLLKPGRLIGVYYFQFVAVANTYPYGGYIYTVSGKERSKCDLFADVNTPIPQTVRGTWTVRPQSNGYQFFFETENADLPLYPAKGPMQVRFYPPTPLTPRFFGGVTPVLGDGNFATLLAEVP